MQGDLQNCHTLKNKQTNKETPNEHKNNTNESKLSVRS